MWYQSLGLVSADERAFAGNPARLLTKGLAPADFPRLQKEMHLLKQRLLEPEMIVCGTPLGELRRLAPAVTLSATPGYWRDPVLVPRGSSSPKWL